MRIVFPWCDSVTASNFPTETTPSSVVWRLEKTNYPPPQPHMGPPTVLLLLLLVGMMTSEDVHNIDSINISATVTDFSANNTENRCRLRPVLQLFYRDCSSRSEVINFTVSDPESLEISLPENFLIYNYVATFLVENLSESSAEHNDREYSVEEVHSEEDGITKLTVIDPHRQKHIL